MQKPPLNITLSYPVKLGLYFGPSLYLHPLFVYASKKALPPEPLLLDTATDTNLSCAGSYTLPRLM